MKRLGYILCALLVMLGGCKSRRFAERDKVSGKMSVQQVLEAVRANEPRFDQAQAGKISVSLTYQERKMTFGGSIGMITDSLAVLSVQPLFGIELFRAELGKDSLRLVDKMNRRYATLPLTYQGIGREQGKVLQDMVCNRLFVVGDEDLLDLRQIDMQKTDKHYVLSFDDPEYEMLRYVYQVDAVTFRISEAQFVVADNLASMRVRYADMRPVDGIIFPHTLDFMLAMPDGQQIACCISLLRLSFQDKVSITPANVGRYERVMLPDLLKK